MKTFNEIQIGNRFKSTSGIVYRKKTKDIAVVVKDSKKQDIVNGPEVVFSRNSKILYVII